MWRLILFRNSGEKMGEKLFFSDLRENFLFFQRNFPDKALIPFIGVRNLKGIKGMKYMWLNIWLMLILMVCPLVSASSVLAVTGPTEELRPKLDALIGEIGRAHV